MLPKSAITVIFFFLFLCIFSKGESLGLKKGNRIAWIGNTFAERMQYFGDIESNLHARYPDHNLVVRNLAWSADTIILRPRPKNFGDIHHYLSEMNADVILACYGFNETWDYKGKSGINQFEADLESFIKELRSKKYNGETTPKILLYSPIACEGDIVPNTSERNRLLSLYSSAMKNVARSNEIYFIDLYSASQKLFNQNTKNRYTINGIHLTSEGYKKLTGSFFPESLFSPLSQNAPLELIRAEVIEKNDTFFDWYRTVNSFYIHGDRRNPYGTVNFPLERKKLLQMTSIRDQRIWKAARGLELPPKIDDSSTVKIPSTLPGSRGGTSPALTPDQEKAKFDVTEGFQVELFASEEEFPELRNPVSINFDASGRLWVATMPSYPHALPGIKANDKILILEDTNQDGKADKRTVFAENLYLPLGFEFGKNGIYVSQEPNLVFLEDTDGDSKADKETILLHGFGSEDCHHAIHNFVWGPCGGLYMQESVFHNTQVETIYGPRRSKDNAIYRFDPRTHRLEIVSRLPPGGNPWGYAINRWGEHLYVGRHNNASLINQPESGNVANAGYGNRDNRNCGQEFISSRHWPDEFQGKVFSNQYKNFQGVLIHDWTEKGTTFNHQRLGKVFEAQNKACIPVDLQLGPEGALYVADWYNPVLGHMQYSLRDERRDSNRGRIWRVTWKGRPLDKPANIIGAGVEELLNLLKAYEDRTRYRARRALWNLSDETLRPALDKWVKSLDPKNADYALHLSEALWLHQQRGWINSELFELASTNPDYHCRAAAAHLLRHWSKDLPGAHNHFLRLANDNHPKVRLETVTSSTWADPSIAVVVLNKVNDYPQDSYLKFAISNARKALGTVLENHPMVIAPEKLAELPMRDEVLKAIIRRPKLELKLREKALAHLATKDSITKEEALIRVIQQLDREERSSLEDWLLLLDSIRVSSKNVLSSLFKSQKSIIRQAAYAAEIRSGILSSIPLDPDALRSIERINSINLRSLYFNSAKKAMSVSGDIQKASLFCLGRLPNNDVEIFNILSTKIQDPKLSAAAAEALLTRPHENWPKEKAISLLMTHLTALLKTSVDKRNSDSFKLRSKLLTKIASTYKLPETVSQIRSLQLLPVKIATIPDQLRFDKTSIQVPTNTPIELLLDNPDAIQHNLVLCTPGSLEKVGLAVDNFLSDPRAIERDWVPDLPEVLHASPMANSNEQVSLRFQSPKEPGSYPFICTVPGHWRIMKGHMIVGEPENKQVLNKSTKQVLILTGEPEYGTRASLGELGNVLEKNHPIKITHLELNRGIVPHRFQNLAEHLAKANLVILSLRFVNLEESQYKIIDEYLNHKPFIAVRTSTHLFDFPKESKLAIENKAFPTRHFGTPYRGHHGHDSSQVNYVMALKHPVMTGIEPRFWTPDFHYAVNPLDIDCTPLMIGQALKGRQIGHFKNVGAHNHAKVLSTDDESRLIGSPHPVVWTIENKKDRRALVTTIGARKSFNNANVQRLFKNSVLWCLGHTVTSP